MAGTVIIGTARSRRGESIVEARVYFTEAPVSMPDIAALTNEKGGFSLHAPVAGTYRIECTAEGFHPQAKTIQIGGDHAEARLVIELVERIGGEVDT